MLKIKFISLFVILYFLQSCNSVSSIAGTYVNRNDSKVENYLQLNSDMTYLHFYKKDNVTLSQRGVWELKKNPYYGIELFQFCDYNEKGTNYEKFGVYVLIIEGKYLNNGFDGNNASSFEKN